jgi:hypothetical protein
MAPIGVVVVIDGLNGVIAGEAGAVIDTVGAI